MRRGYDFSFSSAVSLKLDFQPFLQRLTCRFFVLIERMGIDVQRCRRLAMAQQTGHRGHIRAVGNQQTGIGVP